MNIEVEKVDNQDLLRPKKDASGGNNKKGTLHDVVKNNITEAIQQQKRRFGRDGVYNSSLSSFQVSSLLKLDSAAEKLLSAASEKLNLSARSYFKTIKVAQTIADLDRSEIILASHIAEALNNRKR